MNRVLIILVSVILVFSVGCGLVEKQKVKTGQHSMLFEKTVEKTFKLKYLLYVPEDYNKSRKEVPLILFLHGAGERGDDLNKVKVHGPPKRAEEGKKFEFIIVSPQCPQDSWWPNETETLIHLLDDITENYRVDKSRIYLTGLSMGGYGTWTLACEYPERFAAIAPICGGGEPFFGGKLKNTPVWAFHGAKDNVVPLVKSQQMVDAVNKSGGSAKLTVYPEAWHDSWTETYDNPQLYEWFLSHTKSNH